MLPESHYGIIYYFAEKKTEKDNGKNFVCRCSLFQKKGAKLYEFPKVENLVDHLKRHSDLCISFRHLDARVVRDLAEFDGEHTHLVCRVCEHKKDLLREKGWVDGDGIRNIRIKWGLKSNAACIAEFQKHIQAHYTDEDGTILVEELHLLLNILYSGGGEFCDLFKKVEDKIPK